MNIMRAKVLGAVRHYCLRINHTINESIVGVHGFESIKAFTYNMEQVYPGENNNGVWRMVLQPVYVVYVNYTENDTFTKKQKKEVLKELQK